MNQLVADAFHFLTLLDITIDAISKIIQLLLRKTQQKLLLFINVFMVLDEVEVKTDT